MSLELALYCLAGVVVGMIIEYVYISLKLRWKNAKVNDITKDTKQASVEEVASIASMTSLSIKSPSKSMESYDGAYTTAANANSDIKCDDYEFNAVGIVGFGQIGSAVNTIYKNKQTDNNYTISIHDPYKKMESDLSECDIVNINIPFNDYDSFKQSIIDLNLNGEKSCYIIIHSTVTMGTVNKLQNESELTNHIIIDSPCRGVHPNLVSGFYTFQKYLGISDKYYDNVDVVNKLQNHFKFLNLPIYICKSNEAELAKVLSTTLYGLNIAVTEDIGQICDYYNLSFNNVFTNWQIDYNNGYKKLNKANVIRPVLTRIPNKEKIIGGHCVLPNCVILNKIEPKNITNRITDFILRYSNEHSRKHHTIVFENEAHVVPVSK